MALQLEFHTGVPDELAYACRLLRKAYRQGARVLVRSQAAVLAELDRALWTFAEREFVPHLRFGAAAAQPAAAARTPIWLVEGEVPQGHPPVLVSLGAEAPPEPLAFERIIEIVGSDAERTRQGRARWRAYEAAGLAVRHVPVKPGAVHG